MRRFFILAAVALSILISNGQAQPPSSRTEPLKVGALAPDFTLADTNGKTVKLSAIKQPTVLVFYRGYW